MATVGVYEAKTHLSRLLDRVARGERVIITRHGVPVAQLGPVEDATLDERRRAIAALRAFGRGRRAEGSLREMIDEGRL